MTRQLPPSVRQLGLRTLMLALLAAVVSWYLGTDVWHAILIGVVVVTVGSAAALASTLEVRNIRWRGEGSQRGKGARNDVDVLSWSLRGSYGRVGMSAVSRARSLAYPRLAARGLDLNNEADREPIERLIGSSAYLTLTSARRRPPRFGQLMRCLDVLDALDAARTPPRAARPGSAPARQRSRRGSSVSLMQLLRRRHV